MQRLLQLPRLLQRARRPNLQPPHSQPPVRPLSTSQALLGQRGDKGDKKASAGSFGSRLIFGSKGGAASSGGGASTGKGASRSGGSGRDSEPGKTAKDGRQMDRSQGGYNTRSKTQQQQQQKQQRPRQDKGAAPLRPDGKPMGGAGVRHEKERNRFTMDLGNNQTARIDYRQTEDGRLDLYHTEVPSELRGRGIGKALARGALESLARGRSRVRVTCSYLADYLDRFADERHKRLVDRD